MLIKDKEWSARLARYAALLPALQRGLPVPAAYKREKPGTDSDLNAYDAVYYAGEANAGSQDHRHQPAERRAGAAPEGHPAAPAQERDAGQVRPHPGADRRRADRTRPAEQHQLRRLLRAT